MQGPPPEILQCKEFTLVAMEIPVQSEIGGNIKEVNAVGGF